MEAFMQPQRFVAVLIVTSALTIAAAACNRKPVAPDYQTTTGVQTRSEPTTVAGCLKRGVAEDAFVLMTDRTATTSPTANYQLITRNDVNLANYVGQAVEVSGTLRAEEKITGRSGPMPEQPAKGTAGLTPTVETKTDLEIKRLDVDSVKPTGNNCSE
jgi:hypothetical protein